MAQQASTYRAVHAVSPGKLELVHKPLVKPPLGHVRIRVEACGVCHSDSATVEGILPIEWPRVPGHEAVGRIDAIGEAVVGWSVGQRVGVGFLGGNCGYCEYCRDGDLVNCKNQNYTGVQQDGGYAESMIAKASSLISVPDDLSSVDAAPLLCAGLTTFSALRNSPARAGDLVAILGVGGLGHLGVQYARHMGFEVVGIDRGAGDEPIELSAFALLFQSLGVVGALTGTPAAGDAALRFSTITDVAAMVETMPLEKATDAYAKMMAGQARFRMVLTMG
jgi:propanol-preferring alcohol dehydrogenase